jgi:hypothetical protein
VMGPGYNTFNLVGADKTVEFVRLSTDVQVPVGKHLNWSRGLVSVTGSLLVGTGSDVTCNDMSITGSGTFVTARQSNNIYANNCDFSQLYQAYFIEEGRSLKVEVSRFDRVSLPMFGDRVGELALNASTFRGYSTAVDWLNGFVGTARFCNFYGSQDAKAIKFANTKLTFLQSCVIEDHQDSQLSDPKPSSLAGAIPAVESYSGLLIISDTRIIRNSVGILSKSVPEENLDASSIAVINGSVISNSVVGVLMDAYDPIKGMLLADCSTFWLNREAILGTDITLMLDALNTSTHPMDTDLPNTFVSYAWHANTQQFVNVCYVDKQAGSSNLMRNNFWGSSDDITVTPINPLPKINLRDANCSANISTAVINPVAARTESCEQEEKPEIYGHNDAARGCATNLFDNEGNTKSVNWQFHKGYYHLKTDSLAYAIAELRPVADLWQPDMSTFGTNCRQYIAVARAIVDGFDAGTDLNMGLPPSERSFKSRLPQLGDLMLMPNPSSDHFRVQLPSDEQYTLIVVDAQGRIVEQRHSVTGSTVVSVTDWPTGLYQVVARSEQNGIVKSSNMVVTRQ